ncbi:MAG: hypothetical protein ACRD1O_10430 [Terriglobia bacterium]
MKDAEQHRILFIDGDHFPVRFPLWAGSADRGFAAGIPLEGAADHDVSEAVYLHDPDDYGLELYWDRPEELWPRNPDGQLAMYTRRLDLKDLLKEAPPDAHIGPGSRDL